MNFILLLLLYDYAAAIPVSSPTNMNIKTMRYIGFQTVLFPRNEKFWAEPQPFYLSKMKNMSEILSNINIR